MEKQNDESILKHTLGEDKIELTANGRHSAEGDVSNEIHIPSAPPPRPVPYTVYTRAQKQQLRLLLGLASIVSPLTATIYFPLLPLLREHFDVSAQAINLTLTIYIIFQALSPAVFGPLSDAIGRRLVFLLILTLYAIGNLGLALNKSSYAALLVLRAVQSLGASAALNVSYGVMADICVPSERGKALGSISMALNLGACVGPVIGGAVASTSGNYYWVFWSLVIVSAVLWLGVGALLPETARILVGNGDPAAERHWWEDNWVTVAKRFLKSSQSKDTSKNWHNQEPGEVSTRIRPSILHQCRLINPFACLHVIAHRDTFLSLWMQGSFYTIDYTVVAMMPDIYKDIYHFNELEIGLTYIPRGVGIIAAGFCIGKLMDHNYAAVAKQIGWETDAVAGDDLKHFPIERARVRGGYFLLLTSTAVLIGYGWAVTRHAHLAVVLILQFMQGFMGTCFYNTFNALLVDVFPETPSTASAAASIVRCVMAAVGITILQPILDALDNRGWYCTILGAGSGVLGALAILMLEKKGMVWRTRRRERKSANSV